MQDKCPETRTRPQSLCSEHGARYLRFNTLVGQMGSDATTDDTQGEHEPQVLGKRLPDLVIAYISCPQDSARQYLGGILLTDHRTRPLEFSFVSPVKVTVMQRIIHGRTLDQAIVVDLVAKRLLDEATKPPDIVFVDTDLLLDVQRIIKVPVAKLSRDANPAGPGNALSTLTYITSPGANTETLVGSVLAVLEAVVDLIDPFNRMTEAIREALKGVPPSTNKP